MFDLSKEKVKGNCSKCNTPFIVTLKQVSDEVMIKCSGCDTNIQLRDSDGSTKKGIREINKSFMELEKTLKNFGN